MELSRVNMQSSAFLPKIATSCSQWSTSFGGLNWKEAEGNEEKPVVERWTHVTPCDSEQQVTWPGTSVRMGPCTSPSTSHLFCSALHSPLPVLPLLWGDDFSHSPSPTMFLPYLAPSWVCAGKAPCPLCLANSWSPPQLLTPPFSQAVCPDAPHWFSVSALEVPCTSPHSAIRCFLMIK